VPVVSYSTEIDCPAEEVFAYLEQFARHADWQPSLLSVEVRPAGPVRVGTRVIERRKTPVGVRDIPFEVTEHEPPRRLAFRGTEGPVRPIGVAEVEEVGVSRSRVTFSIELEGHGVGKLVAPVALRQTAKEIPHRLESYKRVLEAGES
jgi:uncharacterized protein YndB with AHSA1/START domain